MKFKVGDLVEVIHDGEWQAEHRASDEAKAKKLGSKFFCGRAAAYLHRGEAYQVIEVTSNGGIRLRGFTLTVAASDLRLSNGPCYR